MPKWKKKRVQKALQQKRQKVYIIIANPQPSTKSNPIPSEVSGSTDSTLERVPAIVSKLIDLINKYILIQNLKEIT